MARPEVAPAALGAEWVEPNSTVGIRNVTRLFWFYARSHAACLPFSSKMSHSFLRSFLTPFGTLGLH